MKSILRLALTMSLSLITTLTFAQDIQTKGSIGGTVSDSSGAALPGATITVTGALGERTATADNNGLFAVENLTPGRYTVKAGNSGFKTAVASNIDVFVGRQSTLTLKLEPGEVTASVQVTDAGNIDQASSATSSNLNDQLFDNIPVQRSVSSLFYLAPGSKDSLGTFTRSDNPSISGGSALDNSYIADGVNITDSAFGGIGTFSRSYGGLGTGITTAFVKEVEVKTAGFEPQYGQSEGGVVNIITKSGDNQYHGALYGYGRPGAFEATRKQPDDFSSNKVGEIVHQESYDFGADLGGPLIRNKLFFFGSFNPSIQRDLVQGAEGSGLLSTLGEHDRRYRSLNYAFKTDWTINPQHQFTFSIFGDPTRTNTSSFRTLNIDNTTAQSALDFGSRSMSMRYTGALSPKWTVSASWAWNHNHFNETGFDNFNEIIDTTQTGNLPGQRGQFTPVGLGFFEPTTGNTYRLEAATSKSFSSKWLLGTHTATIGYQYQRAYYSGFRDYSGPHYSIPAANASGVPLTQLNPAASAAIGQTVSAEWQLKVADSSCTLCPLMTVPGLGDVPVYLSQIRGEYGTAPFATRSNYTAFYGQDVWRVNKYVTANLGLRSEQERIIGNNNVLKYSFTDQWAPRLGVTVDPFARGKTKIFYNFGRFFEYIPLDEGERSLSSELDFIGGRFAPDFTMVNGVPRVVLNQFGTVTPVYDAAHLLTGAAGGTGTGISIGTQSTVNPILPGTKLGFADEHTIGFEQQLPRNFVLSVRYIDRRLKRITEDAAVLAPEDYINGLFGQTYFIGNINSNIDAATNPIPHTYSVGGAIPTACFNSQGQVPFNIPSVSDINGNVVGAVCYEPLGANGQPPGSPIPDGVPDGFPDPVHNYKALEVEVNKRFSNNWQLLSNWTVSRLFGNYEGHFRNDNGQTDPGISSLFDFTAGSFGLLGDQFKPGLLNTDRLHVINVFGSYEFNRAKFGRYLGGLNLGPGIHFETGVPISDLFAHPAYLNAGEIPVGGRGSLGRTDPYFRFDMHANYPWHINEKMKLNFTADFFNVFNSTKVRLPNQDFQLNGGVTNVDFLKPQLFYQPFNMRLGLRFEF